MFSADVGNPEQFNFVLWVTWSTAVVMLLESTYQLVRKCMHSVYESCLVTKETAEHKTLKYQ